MLCIIKKFRRLRVVCLPSMVLSAMACWRCQTTPLTISANHEGRPARGVAKNFPIDFRNVIAKSLAEFVFGVFLVNRRATLKFIIMKRLKDEEAK